MAKKSDSKGRAGAELDGIVRGLKRDAAPAMAKALNLDSAEAVEAAMNAGLELMMAARAFVRAMPLPAETREHLDRAEAETLRAARMAARGLSVSGAAKRAAPAKQVKVDFAKAPKADAPRKGKARARN